MISGATAFNNFRFTVKIKAAYTVYYLDVLVMNTFMFLILTFRSLITPESRLSQGFNVLTVKIH